MLYLLDRTTLIIMVSAFITAALTILPTSRNTFPFWVIAAGLHVGDTLFHELGHAIFAWLFGQPAIPMIFTLFGADQAGGMTMQWDRSWVVQIMAFATLGYGCFWAKENMPLVFIPAIIFSLLIAVMALTGHHKLVIAYMGHGSSIFMGGFFLFRAWIYLDSRNQYERWLNALFGSFLTLYNLSFSYSLAFNSDSRGEYGDHVAFGITHNDFMAMAMMMPGWSVKGIGIFTIGYCVAVIIGAFSLAIYLRDEFCANEK